MNQYIEDNKAFSFMNTFREEGIFPLGLSALSVPIQNLEPAENKLPLDDDVVNYIGHVDKLWREYKVGKKTLEEVKASLASLSPTPDTKETYELSTKQKQIAKNYYGGKRKTRRAKKSKKTRKSSR